MPSKRAAPHLQQSRVRNRGFTFSEIAVVLSMLLILASIAVGLLGRASEKSRRATCQTQLQRLAQAVQLYTKDNAGYFPGDRYQAQVYPYIKSTALIQCPTHSELSDPFPSMPNDANYVWGYLYNGIQLTAKKKTTGQGTRFWGLHETTLRAPGKTWLLSDGEPYLRGKSGGGIFVTHSPCLSIASWPSIHEGGANYAFADGHVRWMRPEEMEKVACSK